MTFTSQPAILGATVNEVNDVAAGASRYSFLGRLKEEFLPAWEDHIHSKVIISKMIAQKKGTMGGRRSLSSVLASLPQSSGIALFENDVLPQPSVGTYFNPAISSRTMYSRLRWTGHVERAAKKGDKVAWAAPRAEDMRAARLQWEINFARMLYLGPRQVLATVKSNSASTVDTTTLYNRNVRDASAANRNRYGAHYLRVGMEVMHVASGLPYGSPVNGDSYGVLTATTVPKITAIDASGADPTIQIYRGGLSGTADFSTAAAAEDLIIPWRSRFDTTTAFASIAALTDSEYAGPNGLLNMVSDTTYDPYIYGIARSTYPTLAGWMLHNSGTVRPFKEDYITLAVDRIGDDGTGDEPDVIMCHKSVRREFVKEIQGDRRFAEIITKKGFGALKQTIGDVSLPLMTDRDCVPGVMWVLESDGFGWFSEADLQMADEGERFVSDKEAHEIVMVKAGNGATRKPHNNAMVDDIQYSVTGLTDLP